MSAFNRKKTQEPSPAPRSPCFPWACMQPAQGRGSLAVREVGSGTAPFSARLYFWATFFSCKKEAVCGARPGDERLFAALSGHPSLINSSDTRSAVSEPARPQGAQAAL